MRIILIRHGRTDANDLGILQGHGEFEINKLGKEQALTAAKTIQDIKIDNFFSSDLKRTQQTSEIIYSYLNLNQEIQYSESLRERDIGTFTNEKENTFNPTTKNIITYKPKDGESLLDVYNRVKSFYNEVKQKNKDKTVVIVSHRDTIAMLLLHIRRIDVREETYLSILPENGSVNILID